MQIGENQMETRKLYYEDCHMAEFTATVLSCEAVEKGWEVILDATASTPRAADRPAIWASWAVPGCWMCRSAARKSSTCATRP